MSLRAAIETVLSSDKPLEKIDEYLWHSLRAGASSPRHVWNWGVFSTSDGQQTYSRTVILRSADPTNVTLDFHTDVRSEKLMQLDRCGVAWLFYSANDKIQLRLIGKAAVINDERADLAWKETSLRSRSAYVSLEPPGKTHHDPHPPSTDDRDVTQEESERGREHFRIVRTQVSGADLLYLRREGHHRIVLDYAPGSGQGENAVSPSVRWVIP